MYYVAPETPMMSPVTADCPDLVPPQYVGQVYAYDGRGEIPNNYLCLRPVFTIIMKFLVLLIII